MSPDRMADLTITPLQNGAFENGAATWRFLGTHRLSRVIPDPDNPVKTEEKEEYDSNNPKPDLEKYDPKKSKLPDKKK